MSGMSSEKKVAYFITPHGFGHAARASAVIEAIHMNNPSVRFELFTRVAEWFFNTSLERPFGYHGIMTDVGVKQKTPLEEDIPGTVKSLDEFLPLGQHFVNALADMLRGMGCSLVMCDISPVGIIAAREAGIPSVLIENFTWDWIYQGYVRDDHGFSRHITYLQEVFSSADYHIQTEPVCRTSSSDITTLPVSRRVRTPSGTVRGKLGIPSEAKLVVITMGGVPGNDNSLFNADSFRNVFFIVFRSSARQVQVHGNVVVLPFHSDFFHPDLVNACDAVIGKLGYSTVAEVYHAGVPFGYVTRPKFRETGRLSAYVDTQMKGFAVTREEFHKRTWLSRLPALLDLPRIERGPLNGADQAAEFICRLLKEK